MEPKIEEVKSIEGEFQEIYDKICNDLFEQRRPLENKVLTDAS